MLTPAYLAIASRARGGSDLWYAPLGECLSGLMTKAMIRLAIHLSETGQGMRSFYRQNPRFIYYAGYPIVVLISLYGLLVGIVAHALAFPLYLAPYFLLQLRKRGRNRALRMVWRSLVIGTLFSYAYLYCFIRHALKERVFNETLGLARKLRSRARIEGCND